MGLFKTSEVIVLLMVSSFIRCMRLTTSSLNRFMRFSASVIRLKRLSASEMRFRRSASAMRLARFMFSSLARAILSTSPGLGTFLARLVLIVGGFWVGDFASVVALPFLFFGSTSVTALLPLRLFAEPDKNESNSFYQR